MADKFDDATKVCSDCGLADPPCSPFCLQKELETFIENEQAQQRMNSSIHMFTSMCWDKYGAFTRNDLLSCSSDFQSP